MAILITGAGLIGCQTAALLAARGAACSLEGSELQRALAALEHQ